MLRVGVCWSGSSYTKPTNRPSACSSVPQDRKSPAIAYAATTWNGEVGFNPTVRLPVQRFSSLKILMLLCVFR